MGENVITTGVDSLLDLLRGVDKISLSDASVKLHIPMDTLQSWVDFLVEERIVGIEYKFTKPFVYLNKEQETNKRAQSVSAPKLKEVRAEYFKRAKQKRIPDAQVPKLWEQHVQQELAYLEPFFTEQAQKRGVQDTRERRHLWDDYNKKLLQRMQEL